MSPWTRGVIPPACLPLLLLLLLLVLPGCPPHGIFSIRSDAIDLYREAARLSGGIEKDLSAGQAGPEAIAGKMEECLSLARRAVDLDPTFLPAQVMVYQLLLVLDRRAECGAQIDTIVTLFPDETLFREQAIHWHVRVGEDPDRAARLIADGIARNPGEPRFHLLEAELLAERKASRKEILERIDRLLSFRRLDGETWARVIGLCALLADEEIGEDVTGPVLALARRDPDLLNGCIAWLLECGPAEEAGRLVAHAASLDEADSALRLAAARLMIRLGDREGVAGIVAALRQDASADPESAPLLAIEGHLRWLERKPEDALRLFLASLDKDPVDVDALEGIWLLHEETELLSTGETRSILERAAESTRDEMVRRFLTLKAFELARGRHGEESLPPALK